MSKYKAMMTKELECIGFSKIKDNFYRFRSPITDIEYILKTSWKFGAHTRLEIDFCIMNKSAVDFAEKSQFLFNNILKIEDGHKDAYDKCSIYFSLGRIAQWGIAPTLIMTQTDWTAAISRASQDVASFILPIFKEITTKKELSEFLIEDTHCTNWMLTNRIRRILEIIYITIELNIDICEIKSLLLERSINTEKYFNPRVSFNEFIERAIALAKAQSYYSEQEERGI